eukprot:CAMPEP_0206513742 /NCGR_PEP_ID=MMETSP0324_2-20121206/61701_1 /ASSEMBLY_ACC=CAM_ASM_000836 /TAXON_ID=2866 /ORGANISM="Crypthecodinium cohnii, Strain Seligo" /LENGTH=146 /DNA_ID=CAMNT_0054006039 /DNA_START=460 /DNA_END=901 /DNA_ORIENTATION=+
MGSIIGTGTIICGTSSACIVGVMMVGVHVESISVFISANPTAAAVVVASVSAVDVVAPTAPGPSPGATAGGRHRQDVADTKVQPRNDPRMTRFSLAAPAFIVRCVIALSHRATEGVGPTGHTTPPPASSVLPSSVQLSCSQVLEVV